MAHISRRTLLSRALLVTAVGSGALLGLTRPIKHKVATPPPPPPVALTAALARQRRLLAGYDQALARKVSHPGLTGLRADVAAHGQALRAVLQHYPGWRLAVTGSASATGSASLSPAPDGSASPAGSPAPDGSASPAGSASPTGSVPASLSALASASRAAAAATTRACLDWPATEVNAAEVVPLLGSIAACLTSHAQVLT